ncbi:related to OTU1 |uniref:Ubiquitin thioesterase OTU n=2 Tax=Pseudozyma flocculosa TaxID=84751 RepID=A0A5C3F1M0_9BASI|nr:related to OTU1 \
MIRIRHPEGTATFKLTPETSLKSLQAFVQELSGIDPVNQELKTGYPPTTLSLLDQPDDLLLSSPPLKLKPGDQVVVARKAGSSSAFSAPQPQQSSSASASSVVPDSRPPSQATPASTFGHPSLTASQPSPPLTTPTKRKAASVKDGQVAVPVDGGDGFLTLKVVPDDNSCLFNSVGFLFEQRLGSDICQRLRGIVADAISAKPQDYPDVVLGQSRESYISKIQSPQAWGGAIELSILSDHFKVEIDSIDVASGVVHRFGEDRGYESRGLVVYSGIHYDVLALLPSPDSPAEFGTTLFPSMSSLGDAALDVGSDPVLQAATKLCDELKKRRYYTDTATFTLCCKICGKGVKGEKEAVQHAKQTGHGDFGET